MHDAQWQTPEQEAWFDFFKSQVTIHHLDCNPGNYKRLPAPFQPFNNTAFQRYMDINLGKAFTTNSNNVSRSSCTHRENLQRFNSPITSQEDFDDLQLQLNNIITFICNTLNLLVPDPDHRVFVCLSNPFEYEQVPFQTQSNQVMSLLL